MEGGKTGLSLHAVRLRWYHSPLFPANVRGQDGQTNRPIASGRATDALDRLDLVILDFTIGFTIVFAIAGFFFVIGLTRVCGDNLTETNSIVLCFFCLGRTTAATCCATSGNHVRDRRSLQRLALMRRTAIGVPYELGLSGTMARKSIVKVQTNKVQDSQRDSQLVNQPMSKRKKTATQKTATQGWLDVIDDIGTLQVGQCANCACEPSLDPLDRAMTVCAHCNGCVHTGCLRNRINLCDACYDACTLTCFVCGMDCKYGAGMEQWRSCDKCDAVAHESCLALDFAFDKNHPSCLCCYATHWHTCYPDAAVVNGHAVQFGPPLSLERFLFSMFDLKVLLRSMQSDLQPPALRALACAVTDADGNALQYGTSVEGMAWFRALWASLTSGTVGAPNIVVVKMDLESDPLGARNAHIAFTSLVSGDSVSAIIGLLVAVDGTFRVRWSYDPVIVAIANRYTVAFK